MEGHPGDVGVSLRVDGGRIGDDVCVLDEWITSAKQELGIELDVDTALLRDVAKDAAHGVARPAAPLTTFLVGYAAGRSGDPEAVRRAAEKVAALAREWAAREDGAAAAAPGGDPEPAE